ncbi:MAG TPA: SIR2 family protein [Thermoanaerobaculia bacterium]|nr:SIR2 family protein [Thermoanaerobaculia bacterium]
MPHRESGTDALTESLLALLSRQDSILFAGAGVACRVGYPTWRGYLELLAHSCESFRDLTAAALIRERAADGNYLGAASVFKTSQKIPEGERLRLLADPFIRDVSPHQLARLDALVQLPFSAIVTTNYDASLHKARANKRGWFSPVERGDGSLRGASLQRDFFIARIHGRAEMPSSMVVDNLDYRDLAQDTDYLDFLLHILKTRPCLFLGFSFDDPAVNSVLDLYEKRCGPHFASLHLALVSADSPSLVKRLGDVNIQTITYDSSAGHSVLWKAIRSTYTSLGGGGLIARPTVPRAPGIGASVHKYMAFAYAQMRSTELLEPVVASIRDGIVLTRIADSASVGVTEDEVITAVKEALSISESEASSLVSQAVKRLMLMDQVVAKGSRLKAVNPPSEDLDEDLSKLADGVLVRLRVRDHIKASRAARNTIKKVLEGAFLARAWDLAAHFAGSGVGVGPDIDKIIGDLLQRENAGSLPSSATRMSIVDLLSAPGDHETEALARIGRAAFGLQLVLSSPRQALFRKYSLPQRIYLDANVVMPAITNGHPLRPIYVDCLRRLEQANKTMGQTLGVGVGYQFLNEIVSHRRLAKEIVKAVGLEDPAQLTRHILFYEAINTNVFVGAFASFVGRQGSQISFSDFLKRVAPYETEAQLAEYLKEYGIETVEMKFFDKYGAEFSEILGRLREGYSTGLRPWARLKAGVLMEHEAAQLTQLIKDQENGLRSIFVTADSELRRLLRRDSRLHGLSGGTMSHLGLVALVDVMVGLDGDSRSFARLVWTAPQREAEEVVFDYFIRLGLRHYREGMAMEMQEAARVVAAAAAKEVVDSEIQLFANDVEDIARTARFIDRYEKEFFEAWSLEMERRDKQST